MTKTTAELRVKVAKKLGIKAPDMELSSEDAATIDDRIEEVTDFLREAGVVWWVDNSIPDAAVMPMVLMVSAWACGDFGKAGQGFESGFADGKTQLASIKPSAVIETVQVDYY